MAWPFPARACWRASSLGSRRHLPLSASRACGTAGACPVERVKAHLKAVRDLEPASLHGFQRCASSFRTLRPEIAYKPPFIYLHTQDYIKPIWPYHMTYTYNIYSHRVHILSTIITLERITPIDTRLGSEWRPGSPGAAPSRGCPGRPPCRRWSRSARPTALGAVASGSAARAAGRAAPPKAVASASIHRGEIACNGLIYRIDGYK